jgi:Ca2+-dependent lipid-binding protein
MSQENSTDSNEEDIDLDKELLDNVDGLYGTSSIAGPESRNMYESGNL